jgi:Zn-dependent protease with chaperone function
MIAASPSHQRQPARKSSANPANFGRDRPAGRAAARVSQASLVLGGLGVASALFVVVRLLEVWRVTPTAGSHHVVILGQRLSYPAANLDAIVVVLLAVLGAVVTARALTEAVREVRSAHRFQQAVALNGLHRLPGASYVLVIADEHPRAFCAGLLRPRLYISSGAVALLDDAALRAVVAHERHHARRRDPLRLATGRVLVRALFFLPGLAGLVARQQALAELSADETAVHAAPANRSALARAMLSFADSPTATASAGIDPARVDYLLGDPPSWRFPFLLSLTATAVLGLLVTVALLVSQMAAGTATLAPPILSRQPCVLVLAVIPAGLGLLAARLGRGLRLRTIGVSAGRSEAAD